MAFEVALEARLHAHMTAETDVTRIPRCTGAFRRRLAPEHANVLAPLKVRTTRLRDTPETPGHSVGPAAWRGRVWCGT